MKLIETRILRGPNVYADFPCFLAVVEDPTFSGPARGLPALLASMVRQLQEAAGTPVEHCEAQPVPGHPGRFAIVTAYVLEKVVAEAFRIAVAILRALRAGETPALSAELEQLQ